MTEVVQPVPRFDITVPRGGTRIVRFTIAVDGANQDLSLPGIAVVFTAKLRDDDAQPTIQKAHGTVGATLPTGVADAGISFTHIDTTSPPDGILDTWVADVTLNPADTEQVSHALLHYDVWLFKPGQEAPCAQGTLKLSPTVLRP